MTILDIGSLFYGDHRHIENRNNKIVRSNRIVYKTEEGYHYQLKIIFNMNTSPRKKIWGIIQLETMKQRNTYGKEEKYNLGRIYEMHTWFWWSKTCLAMVKTRGKWLVIENARSSFSCFFFGEKWWFFNFSI